MTHQSWVREDSKIRPLNTTAEVTLLEAPAEVEDFSTEKRQREHVILSAQLATQLEVVRRGHVLVTVSPTQMKLMTFEVDYGSNPTEVYIHPSGLDEIAGSSGILSTPISAQITSLIPFAQSDAQAQVEGGIYEELTVYGSAKDFWVNAIHGGNIEVGTDLQAQACADRLSVTHNRGGSLYVLSGWSFDAPQSGNDRWHTTAVDFTRQTFTKLPAESENFSFGVGFHGYVANEGQADILIGGTTSQANRDLLKTRIDSQNLGVTTDSTDVGEHLDGDAPDNATNRYVSSGETYQLEQVYLVRNTPAIRDAIATVVADTINELLNI